MCWLLIRLMMWNVRQCSKKYKICMNCEPLNSDLMFCLQSALLWACYIHRKTIFIINIIELLEKFIWVLIRNDLRVTLILISCFMTWIKLFKKCQKYWSTHTAESVACLLNFYPFYDLSTTLKKFYIFWYWMKLMPVIQYLLSAKPSAYLL
jgi:hypothetical protein